MTSKTLNNEIPLNERDGRPRIVVVGGGFGGLQLISNLKKVNVDIILIDRNNYHTFQPLLYQVATAGLEPDSIAYSFRDIFKSHNNFRFRMAEVEEIDHSNNRVKTSIGYITYDYLVLAAGAVTHYFGMKDFEKYAYSLKSIPEASGLRNLILENMEKALLVNSNDRQSLMNIVIVGGGPTGVEMAGALGELKKKILPNDYPELDFNVMQIHVIDMSERLLPSLSKDSSHSAQNFLENFDIKLSLKTKVESYDGNVLTLSNGQKILTNTVIWAAGVTATTIAGLKKENNVSAGRLHVNAYNQLKGFENIFVIGDMASMITTEDPKGHPMLAPVAIQQAKNLAKNFSNILAKKPLHTFKYKNLGVMATVGRNHAVVEIGKLKLQGFIAWLIWLFVHLMTLVGFRNKIIVFVNWTWSYFTNNRALRTIIK